MFEQVLHGDGVAQRLTSVDERAPGELYRSVPAKPNKLAYSGPVTHKLDIPGARRIMDDTDDALLALRNNLAAIEREKQSKK